MMRPGDTVFSPDAQEHVVLCGYRTGKVRKGFGQREGSFLWGASILGVGELLCDFAFFANPLWAWCLFLQENDAEKYGR